METSVEIGSIKVFCCDRMMHAGITLNTPLVFVFYQTKWPLLFEKNLLMKIIDN